MAAPWLGEGDAVADEDALEDEAGAVFVAVLAGAVSVTPTAAQRACAADSALVKSLPVHDDSIQAVEL